MTDFAMIPSERILAALNGLPVDKVPYQEIFFDHRDVAEYFGGPQNSIEDAVNYLANSGQCSLTVGGFWWCPEDIYKNTTSGEKRYAGGRKWTMEDVLSLNEPDITPQLSCIERNIKAAKAKNLACHIFIMNGFHSASSTMGLENLCYTICDAPEVVHEFIKMVEEFNRKVLKKLADFDIDFVFMDGDCAYKTGLMVSPELFSELWFEQTRLTVEQCRENNLPYCYHTDGKIDEVLPMLIELGFNGTHGVESAANDLGDIKERFGGKITLIGNFDIVDLAWRSSDEIKTMTEKMLLTGSKGGRYIAGCNTAVKGDIPLEKYLAFRDCIVNWK